MSRESKLKALAVVVFTGLITVSVVRKQNEAAAQRAQEPPKAKVKAAPDHSIEAHVMCEKAIRAQLKSPATAEFSRSTPRRLNTAGFRYAWEGHLDSQNSFGALIRTEFMCFATCAEAGTCVVDKLGME